MEQAQCDLCEETCVSCCTDCKQCYCVECTTAHTREESTQTHLLFQVNTSELNFKDISLGKLCKICDAKREVHKLCPKCKSLYCAICAERHPKIKANLGHPILDIKSLEVSAVPSDPRSRPSTTRSVRTSDSKGAAQVPYMVKRPSPDMYNGNLILEKPCGAPGEIEITRIRGMTVLNDGRLLIIDSKNECLKIFSAPWYDFVTKKDLKPDDPSGICLVSNEEFAISFASSAKKEIRICKIDKVNNIWVEKSIKTKEKPFSVSYCKKTFAVEMGVGDDGVIALVDMTGRVLSLVKGPINSPLLFTGNSVRLVHDHDKKHVFVANLQGYVHCIDYHGAVIWSNKITAPRGMALNGNTLLVACKTDNMVYQINARTGELFTFLSERHKVLQPRYIAFQPAKQTFVVEVGTNINIYNVAGGGIK